MSEPTLKDCINYMKSQIKQMEKYPRNYEYNLPYYRKTVEILEKAQRPHGKWIPCKDDNFCKCSECKQIVMSEERSNFCPNCGSDNRPRILDVAFDGAGKDGNVKEGDEKWNA